VDTQIVNDAGAAPAAEGAAPAQVTPEPAPAPAQTPVSEILAQHRAARAEAKKARGETDSLRSELATVKAELEKYRGARSSIIADPVGFLRSHGVTDDELPLIGEAAFYERMPDKAPPTLRARMLELRLNREQREREAERQRAAEEARRAEADNRFNSFVAALADGGLSAETHPVSAAWFAESQDEYVQSLVHTARNMAEAAEEAGVRADLSPGNVRKVLEDHLAKRAGRLPGRQPVDQRGAQAPVGEKRTPEAPRGVSPQASAGGTTRAPANTDQERVRRAIAAMDAFDQGSGA
jgi:hypothetical protein